jgi:hypothetical protein
MHCAYIVSYDIPLCAAAYCRQIACQGYMIVTDAGVGLRAGVLPEF